ncbi:hypothetical protein B0H17DRAFT_1214542 [Mycena rosella]|uniref:Uncharacterized protein n=1 Tax=Mycena rosella TaxID=1033263 RepID=A0AAD7CMW2_MYCRO|nr:hypothetical protein B0H17DRAFT_1214542 [Mycena rosella]
MAASRITLDPTLEPCPDYTSISFKPIRDLLVAGSAQGTPLTDAEAAVQLVNSWTTERDARKLLWDAQVQADADQATADADARAAQEALDRAAAEATAEAERIEVEKKKPKLGAFDPKLVIPNSLAPQASNFAKKKLEAKEYIELWYYTREGCLDAESLRGGVQADESLESPNASKKVIRDEDLSWAQFSVAKTGFLAAIEVAGWPQEHRAALASFFYAIESHSSRMNHDEYAETALVIYAARARQFWHESLSQGRGFNIAIINERLLDQITSDHHKKVTASKYRMLDDLAEGISAPRGRPSGRQQREIHHRETGNRIRSASPPRAALPGQNTAFFQQGTGRSDGLSACAVCLGRHRHNVRECRSTTLWNLTTQARTRRNAEGRLVNNRNEPICLNWQRSSCNSNHDSRHECSGCGSANHGAQKCHLAQKV